MKGTILLSAIAIGCAPAAAWELPPDNGTMGRETIAAILAANDYPETSGYQQAIDFIDFSSNGQKFTQVVVTLRRIGRSFATARRSSWWAASPAANMRWISCARSKTRTVRLCGSPSAALPSWARRAWAAGISSRRPRTAPGNRSRSGSACRSSSAARRRTGPRTITPSSARRAAAAAHPARFRAVPKPGTLLDKQLLAATGGTFIEGYRLALQKAIPDRAEFARSVLGHVDGRLDALSAGEILHARRLSGLGYQHDRLGGGGRPGANRNYNSLYEPTAARVRERGLDDFEYYTVEIDPQTRAKWWQAAQRNPRFKSTEDPPMGFNASAIAETAMRLWYSDFLPDETRKRGFVAFMQDMFEPTFPPAELKKAPVLDLNGTKDEVLPPPTGRCQPQGDGALHKEIPGRTHRGAAPLSVHAG